MRTLPQAAAGMSRTLTIAEAAEATGISAKSIRNRCDRGQLRFLVKGGRRRIPLVELERAGLLNGAGEEFAILGDQDGEETATLQRELVNRELLSELAQAHEQIGALRAIEERTGAERERIAAEAREARAEAERLEAELAERELELQALRSRGVLERLLNR